MTDKLESRPPCPLGRSHRNCNMRVNEKCCHSDFPGERPNKVKSSEVILPCAGLLLAYYARLGVQVEKTRFSKLR